MKVAIMQPTFFPWAGYFSMINEVDVFVFLDDVEYSHQSWQSRNYFEVSGLTKWISLPISSSSNEIIKNIKIDNLPRFLNKTSKTLKQSYAKCPRNDISDDLFECLKYQNIEFVSDFNIFVIKYFCKYLDINTEFICSSQLGVTGQKSEKVKEILKSIEATSYVSSPGSRNYMIEYGLENFNCEIEFFNYRSSADVTDLKRLGSNMSIYHTIRHYSKEEILNAIQ